MLDGVTYDMCHMLYITCCVVGCVWCGICCIGRVLYTVYRILSCVLCVVGRVLRVLCVVHAVVGDG